MELYRLKLPLHESEIVDIPLVDVLQYLIANRIHEADDTEEQRELVDLLILIRDNAPKGD